MSIFNALIYFACDRCDDGWADVDCSYSTSYLYWSVYDTMTGKADPDIWSKVIGGTVTEICRNLASGTALHFTGVHSLTYKHVEL